MSVSVGSASLGEKPLVAGKCVSCCGATLGVVLGVLVLLLVGAGVVPVLGGTAVLVCDCDEF